MMRRIFCAGILMVAAALLPLYSAAEQTEETVEAAAVCYTHGDVDGNGTVDANDAYRILYSGLFGQEEYPLVQSGDFVEGGAAANAIWLLNHPDELQGTVHNYYDPICSWSDDHKTAEFVLSCPCGQEHEPVKAEVTREETQADCVTSGQAVYTAQAEGFTAIYTEVLPPKGHSIGEATCEKNAVCANEGCTYEVPALGHAFVRDDKDSIAADCRTGTLAQDSFRCTRCDTPKKGEPQKGSAEHKLIAKGTQDLGDCKFCELFVCQNCGTEFQEETYEKHIYGKAEMTKEPTCQTAGQWTYTCTQCGAGKYTEDIPAGDAYHAWEFTGSSDQGSLYSCKHCSGTKTVAAAANDGTVTKEQLAGTDEVALDNGASLALDDAAQESLQEQDTLILSVEKVAKDETGLTPEQQEQIPGDTVYDFNLKNKNGENLTFDGKITISLPYTPQEGEDLSCIDIWYISDSGEPELLQGVYANGYVVFTTDHFSYYTVTRMTPAQRCQKYGHVKVTVEKPATCTADGYRKVLCQRCNETMTEEILSAAGHSWTVTEAATCVSDGSRYCTVCKLEQKVLATGHELEVTKEKEVSCTKAGTKTESCRHCDYVLTTETQALGHDFQLSEAKNPGCSNSGHELWVCSRCQAEERRKEKPSQGHKFDHPVWAWDENKKLVKVTLTCTHDENHTIVLDGVITAQTVTSDICNADSEIIYTATASYNMVTYTDKKQVSNGNSGHNLSKKWSYDDAQHYHICNKCKKPVDAADHQWDEGTVLQAATCGADGSKKVVCEICAASQTIAIPATREHNFVNGICTGCQLAYDACEHLRVSYTLTDVSSYGICDGVELRHYSCDCGRNQYDTVYSLYCSWGEDQTREETAADGTVYTVHSRSCRTCGLVMESYNGTRLDLDTCTTVFSYKDSLRKNGVGICQTREETYEETHLLTEEGAPIALTRETHGLCGLTLVPTSCACGENTGAYEQEGDCQWSYDSDSSDRSTEQHVCETCGAVRRISRTVAAPDASCAAWTTETVQYLVNGQEVHSYESRYFADNHDFQLDDYTLYGETCEDGLMVRQVCANCGEKNEYFVSYHAAIVCTETDLSQHGLCVTAHRQYACPCSEKRQSSELVYGEKDCNWEQVSYDDSTNTLVLRCTVCGLRWKQTETEGEKDAQCEHQVTVTNTYTGPNGTVIAAGKDHYTTTSHDYRETYTLPGESCTDGLTITRRCADCGNSYSQTLYDHYRMALETYDLSGLDMCCESVRVMSCPCGQEETGLSWRGGCSWEHSYGGKNVVVEICRECGVQRTRIWTAQESEDPCLQIRDITVTLSREKKELLTFQYSSCQNSHQQRVYTLELVDPAGTCEDGYRVSWTCQTCGGSGSYGTNYGDHNVYAVARNLLSIEGICSAPELVTYSCACGEEHWSDLSEGQCNYLGGGSYDYETETWTYTCADCGIAKVQTFQEEQDPEDACLRHCAYNYTFRRGEKVLLQTATEFTEYDHDMIATFTLQGSTCDDGYYVNNTCQTCGKTERYGLYTGCGTWVTERSIVCTSDQCGDIVLCKSSCPCGKQQHYSVEYQCEWEHVDSQEIQNRYYSIYSCRNCQMEWKNWNSGEQDRANCLYIHTLDSVYRKDGIQVGAVNVSYSYPEHTYLLADAEGSCDGYHTLTQTCAYCQDMQTQSHNHPDGHCRYLQQFWDLQNYGLCSGYLQQYGCLCGESGSYSEYFCGVGTGWEDSQGFQESYCSDCDTYYYVKQAETIGADCIRAYTRQVKLVRGGEVLLEATLKERSKSHDYRLESVSMAVEGGTCLNGFTANLRCLRCGDSCQEESAYHSVYLYEQVPLGDEDESCGGGEIEFWRCPCGQEGWYSENFADHGFSYDEESRTGDSHNGTETYIRACRSCDTVIRYQHIYTTREGSCQRRNDLTLTLNRDGQSRTLTAVVQETMHEWENAESTLNPGSDSCEDGITVRQVCTRCGADSSYRTDYHVVLPVESIDLSQYGAICGAALDRRACACGSREEYAFSQDTNCDVYNQGTASFVPGAINGWQYTTEGYVSIFSNFYLQVCAVTDPQACGLKIRMGDYWLAEGCEAVRYQTWQLGYDDLTDTWQKEITIATGERRAYHAYITTSLSGTNDDGTTYNGTSEVCQNCGSSHMVKYHYNNGTQVKFERLAVNTLGNGEHQRYHHVVEYGFVRGGYCYETRNRTDLANAAGDATWNQSVYTYDFTKGCRRTCVQTDSSGHYHKWEENAHITTYQSHWKKDRTCSQFGEYYEGYLCKVCGEVSSEWISRYEPYDHSWYHNGTTYVCSTCGLENENGASGAIVMEDLSASDSNVFVLGYWNRGGIAFYPYVSVILEEAGPEVNDELVLTGLDAVYLEEKTDGINAIRYDRNAVLTAAKTVVDQAGYTGKYGIRFSLVPKNTDDTLDYAITIDPAEYTVPPVQDTNPQPAPDPSTGTGGEPADSVDSAKPDSSEKVM